MTFTQSQFLLGSALVFVGLWIILKTQKKKERFAVSGYGYRGQKCGCVDYKENLVYPRFCACAPATSSPVDWDFPFSSDRPRNERCLQCLENNEECVNGQVWCRKCSSVCSKFIS